MTNEHSLVSTDYFDHDLYTSSRTRERALNAAIVQADISENFEEYLEIFDAFYDDDIAVSGEAGEEPIRGKARVRSLIANFLVPFHVMAEVGGLLISVRQTAIPGDSSDELHSAWTLDLVGMSGRTCTLSWRALRKWNGSRVIYEHHYDHQQNGGPLTSDDLSFRVPAAGFRTPSWYPILIDWVIHSFIRSFGFDSGVKIRTKMNVITSRQKAFIGMLEGRNFGKVIVRVAAEGEGYEQT